jgi:hypothetical protein
MAAAVAMNFVEGISIVVVLALSALATAPIITKLVAHVWYQEKLKFLSRLMNRPDLSEANENVRLNKGEDDELER